jgi:hypothetical protein
MNKKKKEEKFDSENLMAIDFECFRRNMPRKKKEVEICLKGETKVKNYDEMSAADRCFEIRDHVIALINSEAIGSPGYELAIDLLEAIARFKNVSALRK